MTLEQKLSALAKSGLTIYGPVAENSPLFLTTEELRTVLDQKLTGLNLDYPNRTRSKILKQAVCEALGCPVPRVFTKTKPRFPGQNFDTYVQKSNNLQIWNEQVNPTRRYVVIRVDPATKRVDAVQAITGEALAKYDRTGTLTSKFQAIRRRSAQGSVLVSNADTENFRTQMKPKSSLPKKVLRDISATDAPLPGKLLTIDTIFDRLQALVGSHLNDPGLDQERLRGVALQQAVCNALGLSAYGDSGQFPDILSQALEVKLQTAPTIDLGLVSPDSADPLPDIPQAIRHCDIRYAVFYATRTGAGRLKIDAAVVSSGSDFFKEFTKCAGKVINRKLQLRLPMDFYE
jgi:hypothetical protein